MLTIGYSTRTPNPKYMEYLEKSCMCKDVQIIEKVNDGKKTLSEVYNEIVSESKYNIVVLCHDDIKLEKNWGKKLLNDFSNNPDFGIIGKAGSCYFPSSGIYWEKLSTAMAGQVYHQPEGQKKWLSRYCPKFPFLIPVVTVDGLFISFDKTKVKHLFDETIGRFHFYDHLFCLPNFLDGVKIGVTSSFEITHESVGKPNQEFFETRIKFLEKWGSKLPLDLKPEKIYIPEIKKNKLKNVGKVAVIIPTKGKIDLLEKCVKSFYEHCDKELFTLFIADTGSNTEEKNFIKNELLPLGDIKLIEYDYYNFSKINNDVVKNYVGNEYEFLLFCNNDVWVLNDVIQVMLQTYKTQPKVGTVGARLHYENNIIQHCGIIPFFNKLKQIAFIHAHSNCYYNYNIEPKEFIGSTGALLMIRKKTFELCGYFNESYQEHFEDLELNIKCVAKGYKNYYNGYAVAYHIESQTRKVDHLKNRTQNHDFDNLLIPFFRENIGHIKKYCIIE